MLGDGTKNCIFLANKLHGNLFVRETLESSSINESFIKAKNLSHFYYRFHFRGKFIQEKNKLIYFYSIIVTISSLPRFIIDVLKIFKLDFFCREMFHTALSISVFNKQQEKMTLFLKI